MIALDPRHRFRFHLDIDADLPEAQRTWWPAAVGPMRADVSAIDALKKTGDSLREQLDPSNQNSGLAKIDQQYQRLMSASAQHAEALQSEAERRDTQAADKKLATQGKAIDEITQKFDEANHRMLDMQADHDRDLSDLRAAQFEAEGDMLDADLERLKASYAEKLKIATDGEREILEKTESLQEQAIRNRYKKEQDEQNEKDDRDAAEAMKKFGRGASGGVVTGIFTVGYDPRDRIRPDHEEAIARNTAETTRAVRDMAGAVAGAVRGLAGVIAGRAGGLGGAIGGRAGGPNIPLAGDSFAPLGGVYQNPYDGYFAIRG